VQTTVAHHHHAECRKTPSIPSRFPEATSEPKVLFNRLPYERTAGRKPSLLCMYHFERRNKAPSHSVRTCAEQSRTVTHWEKCTIANAQEGARQKCPDRVMSNSGQGRDGTLNGHANGRHMEGFPIRSRNIFLSRVVHKSAEGPNRIRNKRRTKEFA
jgi:hypothetical protein